MLNFLLMLLMVVVNLGAELYPQVIFDCPISDGDFLIINYKEFGIEGGQGAIDLNQERNIAYYSATQVDNIEMNPTQIIEGNAEFWFQDRGSASADSSIFSGQLYVYELESPYESFSPEDKDSILRRTPTCYHDFG